MKLLRKRLKNGITVIMEKRDLPVVSLCIANKFGAIFEDEKRKGIAHFIEHMLFTGTKTRTHEDISGEIEKKGGILNAFTSQEVTSFWFKLPSEHIDSGLDILVDMLNNSTMNEEKFEREKKIILEEIKMHHDSPRAHAMEMIEQSLYKKPFGIGVIGTKDSVSAMKRDEVFKCYKSAYKPSNFVVVAVGNADFEKLCSKMEKSFKGADFTEKEFKAEKSNGNKIEEREGIDQAHLVFGMHAPLHGTKENYALQILNSHLAGGMSSQLFLEIREKRGLAYSVHGDISSEKSYAYMALYVGTRKDAIDEVKKLIIEGFRKAKNMTEEQLREAKQRLIGLRKVSSEESHEVMNALLFNELAGKAEEHYKFDERIREVTLDDVRKMANIGEHSFAAVVPK